MPRAAAARAFNGLGDGGMHHEAHVGVVYAHTVGNGGAHDAQVAAQPRHLNDLPLARSHACVVEVDCNALLVQICGHFLRLLAREAVHDARGSGVLCLNKARHALQRLLAALGLGEHLIE